MIVTSQHEQCLWKKTGDLQSMENSADRFFKGFSLEDYRLQVLVKSLEKEKKQCLNRLKEETHVFKMSARLPVKRGQEYWSQYGENFHANGDKREKASVTHLSAEYNKEDLNSINTADQDNTNSSKPHRSVKLPSDSPQRGSGNRNVQRNSLQRMRSISNRKYDSSEKPKVSGLTLLDILCGDFEHGVILLEKSNKPSDSRFGNTSNDLDHQRDKQSKKAHKEGRRERPSPSDIYKSGLKSESKKESSIQSQISKENRFEVTHSEVGDTDSSSRSKPVSFEALNSDDTLNTSSISTWGLNSQESVPLRDVSAQKLNWTSDNSVISFGLGEAEKSLQSPGRQSHEWNSSKQTQEEIELLAAEKVEHSASSNKVEESVSSNQTCLTSSSEGQVCKHQCRFVHLKEVRKLTRKKGNKQKLGVNMNNEKEKLNRTKHPEVKLFQVDVPHTSQRIKSQEEIDRETRQKMDNFFAKVEHTKNFQPGKPRWRCSSSSERAARRNEWKSSLEAGKRPHPVKKHGYRRALPWPTEVWS